MPNQRVLDVSTGTGEAALAALPIVGTSGMLVGADIAPAMLEGARKRLNNPDFHPVAADGQALPFRDGSFDALVCQLGLQFFRDPARGLAEFRRVLRPVRVRPCASSPLLIVPRCGAFSRRHSAAVFPSSGM